MKNLSTLRTTATAVVIGFLPRIAHAQPRPFGSATFQELIGIVIRNVLGLMGTISLVVFVYAGFLWMTAQGDDKQIAKAKSTITYAVIGILISFLSFSLVSFVLSTLETAAN